MQPHVKPILLPLLLYLTAAAAAVARPYPIDDGTLGKTYSDGLIQDISQSHPLYTRSLALRIKNLPDGYTGKFITFVSICPRFPATGTFIRFFKKAAALSATDPSPGRRHQRFTFGALALELVIKGQDEIVTREFVQATSLWLLDAAVKGWTGFFRAWVTDGLDGQVVEVRMGTIYDMPADDRLDIEM